jgi:Uma2 family endonuclease
MWTRGELDDHLHLPDDGTRVEVIGGEIVVSPAPLFSHAMILTRIHSAVDRAGVGPETPWTPVQVFNLDLTEIGDGYQPDLAIMRTEVAAWCEAEEQLFIYPHQLELVVEVTSKSNAHNDRQPIVGRRATKWTGYARCGVPYYLLIDRDPRQSGITLFSEPNRAEGRYQAQESWKFGDPVVLPEPFGIEIDTSLWRPWRG